MNPAYVGRLAPEKRLGFLEQAWSRIRSRAPDTALVLVGDGPARADLEERAPPGVHLTGFLKGEALARAFASADVFVFPSDTETFGNVVAEAMASGVAVVGVHAGGVIDIVRDGETGLVVQPNDLDAFVEPVLRLLSDAALRTRLGRQARSEAQGLSWERVLDGLFEDYEDALGEARCATPSRFEGPRISKAPRAPAD